MFYFDWTYFALVLPAVLISMWASAKVKSTFRKYDQVRNARGLTGYQVARMILDYHGLNGVQVIEIPGELSDHYDPKAQVVRLSSATFSSTSVSAVGVAAHETGHAIQYAEGYMPIRVRMAIQPVCQVASNLTMPLVIIGLIFSFQPLITMGILFFAVATLFQVATLPVEFNASSQAMSILENARILEGDELEGANATLRAAALTYLAALLVSLMNLLRLIVLSNQRNNR